MTDEPQGQGWWQASDLKWYPPEHHPVTALPPPPILPTPPVTPRAPSGQRKVGFVIAGLVLLAFADLAAGLLVPVRGLKLLGYLVVIAVVIIGVTLVVRAGLSGTRKVMLVIATVLVAVAIPVAGRHTLGGVLFGNGPSGGGSPSASFCADFLNLWDGPQGVSNAIVAVQVADAAKEYRAHGWTNTALLTAAKSAQTLAAEAPSDQLKTDFTNIAQTLSAHANLDLTYHGTGKEPTEVDGSTLTARCRIQGARGH
jgi:hypothetical protein